MPASRNEGDWTCPKCGNMNFGFRTVCNRGKCGAPRPPATPVCLWMLFLHFLNLISFVIIICFG